VRSLMNEVSYVRIDGRNRLTLKHRLAHRREGGRMELSETVTNGVTVLEVAGRIDSLTAPDFEARLSTAMNAARLVLDFRELLYISSAGFRVLYRAAQRVKDSNGKLVICGLSDSVRELFDITGFTQIFTFVGSRDDGIAALG
jgi:anti-sigma B factor antagonist